jgi:hypothetical protein
VLVAASAVLRARAFEVWCVCAVGYFIAARIAGNRLPRGVQLGILAAFIAVAVVGLLVAARQARCADRKRRGLCMRCGYDLTANASGGARSAGRRSRPPRAPRHRSHSTTTHRRRQMTINGAA